VCWKRAHRTVWCATGQCPVHQAIKLQTSHSRKFQGALCYNSPDCSVSQQSNGSQAPTVDYKSTCHDEQSKPEVRAQKSEDTGLSCVAPDCLVPQQDNGSNGRPAPNPMSHPALRNKARCISYMRQEDNIYNNKVYRDKCHNNQSIIT
jgi:hypothetical protein